ncbi:MAG: sodium:proton antiporter [Lewinella sp.]|nr:sodium:proton antiporter [Lewinella sp.]
MLELAGIIILGIVAQWVAWRVKVPAILPLILTGLLVGPISTYFTDDGAKLLNPIYNEATNSGLFPGEYLFYFVSLAIGIILFEGGLTLKRREISEVGPTILKLITLGSLITFIGAGLAAHFIMGLSWPISFLFGGLVIVTGPTVIAPILQNVPLTRNVATVLKWEGILIDPIGALVAVLVFEFIQSSEGGVAFTSHAFMQFVNIILIGLALGAIAGYSFYLLVKHELIPHYLLNVFALASVLSTFVFSHLLAHESGLLTVVVMGTVIGNLEVPRLKEILSFKESLSILLISILFILLAANIDVGELELLVRDWRTLALFATVGILLRPISVLLSTNGSGLQLREKLFISWVGPRGIVAAGIASLFGITLTRNGVEDAQFITPLVFLIVLGTVLLNATTARLAARWLRVIQDTSSGVLIIGANTAARTLAVYLQRQGRHVVLVDNNSANIERARRAGLEAYVVNVYNDELSDYFELLDMGYILAMTSSGEINQYAVNRYRNIFGELGTFRLIAPEEITNGIESLPDKGILSYRDDFINFSEAARDYPTVFELKVESKEQFLALLDQMNATKQVVPLFYKDLDEVLQPIPRDPAELPIATGYALVYMGRKWELMPAAEPKGGI